MNTSNSIPTAGEIPAASEPPTKSPTPPKKSTKDSFWFTVGDNLVQHTRTGTYYARVKVNGKTIRASLGTKKISTARTLLPDKVLKLRAPKAAVGSFGDGRMKYESETRHGYTSKKNRFVKLAPLSIAYRLRCAEFLGRSLVESIIHPGKNWKELNEQVRKDALEKLDKMSARDFTKAHCEAWQSHYSDYSPSVFNNTVNTFRRILELAGLPHDENPAFKIGRRDILEKPIRLPSPEQFDRIIELVETSGGKKTSGFRKVQADACADLIRFLAYTGARISEAKQATWADVNWQENQLQIHSVKVRGAHNGNVTRIIPLNPALKQLLERLRREHPSNPTDRICRVSECQKSLDSACEMAGCKRITHHDLRHYFVTKCLQAGVDVFTLAKWIGHRDNGKLLLKVYSHLQAEHSQSMANKVTFGAAPLPANAIPLPKEKSA